MAIDVRKMKLDLNYKKPDVLQVKSEIGDFQIFDAVLDSTMSALGYKKNGGEITEDGCVVVNYIKRNLK